MGINYLSVLDDMNNLLRHINEDLIIPLRSSRKYSVEMIITGRNDSYEPNWYKNMVSAIEYNRSLFERTAVDYHVAFVEWNPAYGKQLLSPQLLKKFPYLRAIVVDRSIHKNLCQSKDLSMMLNFSINAAIRTSPWDFLLVSGGDVFIGRDTAGYMKTHGLLKKCLYRAERVDIRNDLDFRYSKAEELENPPNIVRIHICDLPPYDIAPYTNACGDFLLLDTESFKRIRGFDENILDARLHLDSRFALNVMSLGYDAELIGHIFHIDHRHSSVNLGKKYPGKKYDYTANIPYLNNDNWGLNSNVWKKKNDRLHYIS